MEIPAVLQRGTIFQRGIAALRDAGIDNPVLDAAVLLGFAAGEPTDAVLMDRKALLTASQSALYSDLIRRRCGRTPVSRIVGEREFYSRNFLVTDDVLDPRPETEILVEEAIRCLKDIQGDPAVLDIGTGSGAIAVTVAAELPRTRVTATDISMAALAVARRNAVRHNVDKRLNFIQADLLNGIRGEGNFQAILSNPPYIAHDLFQDLQDEVRKGDPMVALVPGAEGTECYAPLARSAMNLLEEGGRLIVEIGTGQAEVVAGIFRQAGLADVRIVPGLAGTGRVVTGGKEYA